ncbi:MAG: 4-hydroxy-tetrahydrodipicolinate reductase [Spirochaetaceae bacterium]|nr:4-hydroxy-tetrahydrodipicolinate reductase [Spirochaetaceae bacterium]
MKVLLVGYGRMGHEVEAALNRRGHSVVARIDAAPGAGDACSASAEQLTEADVAIEFSLASAVRANAAVYAKAGLPAVVGTTGWKEDEPAVRDLVAGSGIGFLRTSNFSIGAHIFFALVEEAARIAGQFEDYDVLLHEIHHNQKKDSPSGTALAAAARVLKALPRKKRIVTEKLDRQIAEDELHVSSSRVGAVPGLHTLLLDSAFDSIEVTHTARSRGGFAVGAVRAAEWLTGADNSGKKTGFFEVEDFINAIFSKRS